MTRLFSNQAEFGKMLKSPEELKVSAIIHKAFIDVNELGTEAAAATGKLSHSSMGLSLCILILGIITHLVCVSLSLILSVLIASRRGAHEAKCHFD